MTDIESFDADEILGWVEAQTRFGARRPASPPGRAAERYLADQLQAFGLERVRMEPIPIVRWEAKTARLETREAKGAFREQEAFPIPYVVFSPPSGVWGPLVWADSSRLLGGRGRDWRGKVVVTEIGFPPLPVGALRKLSPGIHDPEGSIELMSHPATWVRLGWHVYREAARRGAVGFIGILRDQPGGTCRMYAPYGFKERDILDRPVPGFWVGRSAGPALRHLARRGGQARLTLTGVREPGLTHNVVGEIPGEINETTVLSCHHDSPFRSPVEDGTGVAVVLALAKRFAARHAAGHGLRRRLVVLLSAGHFYGSIGTRTFIREHPDVVRRAALEVTIEHIAREAEEDATGALVTTGRPEATGIFVPFSRLVSETVLGCVRRHGLDRSLLLPAEGPLGPYPPTDGGDWWAAGVPVVNHISNPVYLLTDTDADATRFVDIDRLPRVAATFADLLTRLDGVDRQRIAARDRPLYAALMRVARIALHARTTKLGLHPVY